MRAEFINIWRLLLQAIDDKIAVALADLGVVGKSLPDVSTPITLDTNADTLLSLTDQQLGLDTEAANKAFLGPSSGSAAVPTFRSVVTNDLPDTAVTPGTYGSNVKSAVIVVDAKGRLTNVSEMTMSGGGGGGVTGTQQNILSIEGPLNSVGAIPFRFYNRTGVSVTIGKVFLSVGAAPTGSAVIVDVHKNGTTIFTNQADRPSIAASATTGFTTTIDISSFADGDYFEVIVDQYGSTIPGSNLTVQIATAPGTGVVIPIVSIVSFNGALNVVGPDPLKYYNVYASTRLISKVLISVGVAPTGQSIKVDIHKNGTTIFTNQAHRPEIAAGTYSASVTSIDVPTWNDGDYLEIIVDQYGSATPGSYLVVQIAHG